MGQVIPFVPRNSADRRPMIEQPQSLVEAALDVVNQISVPRCHDDLQGGSVLPTLYETSLGYVGVGEQNHYHNERILERMRGVPASVSTLSEAESAQFGNPNVPEPA